MLKKDIPVITIDGPSGAGKGKISQQLAKKLNWHILDSGAVYRTLAFFIMRKQLTINNTALLVATSKNLDLKFVKRSEMSPMILLAGEDITTSIRQEECGKIASQIAVIPEVRAALIGLQRNYRQLPGLIADGRDMGTKVFPNAQLKVFLIANAKIRAKRRFLQLQDQGISATLDAVLEEILIRDQRDQTRNVSPLKPATDAMIIDTTKLTINEVLQQILVHVT